MIGKVVITSGVIAVSAQPRGECTGLQYDDWNVNKGAPAYAKCTSCVKSTATIGNSTQASFEDCGGAKDLGGTSDDCNDIDFLDWVSHEGNYTTCTNCVRHHDTPTLYNDAASFKACGGEPPCDGLLYPQTGNPSFGKKRKCNDCLLYFPGTNGYMPRRSQNFLSCGGSNPSETSCDGLVQENLTTREDCLSCVRWQGGDLDFAFVISCGGQPFQESCYGMDYVNYDDQAQCVQCIQYWTGKAEHRKEEVIFVSQCAGNPTPDSCQNTKFYNKKGTHAIWSRDAKCETCVKWSVNQGLQNDNLTAFLVNCGGEQQTYDCKIGKSLLSISWTEWSEQDFIEPIPAYKHCTACVLTYDNDHGTGLQNGFELCGGELSCRNQYYKGNKECKACQKHFRDEGGSSDEPSAFYEDCGGLKAPADSCADFDWKEEQQGPGTVDPICISCVDWYRDAEPDQSNQDAAAKLAFTTECGGLPFEESCNGVGYLSKALTPENAQCEACIQYYAFEVNNNRTEKESFVSCGGTFPAEE